MKKILLVVLFSPLAALAASAGYRLDSSPHDLRDLVSLQAGARTYVNYCLGCHGVQFMRYQSLTELGLSEAQIKEHLLFAADKVGEPMKVALDPKVAKAWFGVAPPDRVPHPVDLSLDRAPDSLPHAQQHELAAEHSSDFRL